jgi:membrane protein DedA with SNARE-associated domain
MPVPGDVFVMYIGHHVPHYLLTLLLAWLGLIGIVLLGATNLYLISRRWGRALLERRLARMAHLTPERMARAEAWFDRWGPWALIVGRHVPGLRVPLTVGAGVFGVGYRTFATCVVVSTAIWAGFFITVGATFGGRVGHLLGLHRSSYVLLPLLIIGAFVGYFVYRLWQTRDRPSPAPATPLD